MFGKRTGDTLKYNRVETVIGEGTEIRGNIQSSGVVRIDGYLEGDVDHQGELVVGPKGRVHANVRSREMAVAGEVRGDVLVVGKLEILASGKLFGDIQCGHLVIQEGAVFEGRSQMQEDAGKSRSMHEERAAEG